MTMQEFKLDIRVYEFAEGGFVVTEVDANGEHSSPRAVTTMTEVSDEIRRKVTRWNQETMRLRAAEMEDQGGNVVSPRKWWRAVK